MKKNTQKELTEFEPTHDGQQAKAVYLDALATDTFSDPVDALKAFTDLHTAFIKVCEQPAMVISIFERYTAEMTHEQRVFIAIHLRNYFQCTVFDDPNAPNSEGITLHGILEPMRAYTKRLERSKTRIKMKEMREALNTAIRDEIDRLPETLASLDPKDRMNFVCKMMPYVFPSIGGISATHDENHDISFWGID